MATPFTIHDGGSSSGTTSIALNNTHLQASDFDSIDTFLGSLSLSSLQLLNSYCVQNGGSSTRNHTSAEAIHTGGDDAASVGSAESAQPYPSAWTTNPALLCDRFFQNYANLTNSALQFLGTGSESSPQDSTLLWTSSVTGTNFASGSNSVILNDDEDTYLSPSKLNCHLKMP